MAVFYVAPNGSNNNSGTFDRPWATPAYGANQLNPGDTLILRPGQYILSDFGADMITPPSGRADAWITIKGEEGTRPILVGKNNLYAAIEISNVNYLRIENLEICSNLKDPYRAGISSWDAAAHVILNNLYIHHLDDIGINLRDIDDLQILNCRIEYCAVGAIGGSKGVQGGWRNIIIKNCRLAYSGHYYQGTPGPSPYSRPDGFGIEPSTGPVEIADTVAEHNRGDGLDSKSANTYIHNCVVANNSCDGIKLWANNSKIENCLIYGTGDGDVSSTPWAGIVIDNIEQAWSRFEIVNTTLANDRRERGYLMYVQYSSTVPINLLIRNSIFSHGPGVVFIGSSVNFTSDHNLYYRPGENIPLEVAGRGYTSTQIESGAVGSGNLARDPLFIEARSVNPLGYELQAASPAIDAGTSQGAPNEDLLHRTRPMGLAPDMGAYERMSVSQPPVIVATNPVNGAQGVSINQSISVTFSKTILAGPLYAQVTLVDTYGRPVNITKVLNGVQLILTPQAKLNYSTGYKVTIPGGAVKDLDGNPIANTNTVVFTTEADLIPPVITGSDPKNGATGVLVNKTIIITFSETVLAGTTFNKVVLKNAKGRTVAVTKALSGNILSVKPKAKLSLKTKYTLVIPAKAVKDQKGNFLAKAYSMQFTTQAK